MRVAVACDHAGFPLKHDVIAALRAEGHEPLDLGKDSTAPVDYPDVAELVAHALIGEKTRRGVIICGSGVGATVAANTFPGIRAAVCHDTFSARQGVEDDDINVLCLGARVVGPRLAGELVRTFMRAVFSGAERHARRLRKLEAIESRFRREPE
ncbi:MAG: RpiB/LacA/LacB family sugar-phosphate isomerase [Chloroflexi bacterium]|nr:RpiB/LacA/LacB family sugar-phosphate isomerase [Chloroflexota bacterium]